MKGLGLSEIFFILIVGSLAIAGFFFWIKMLFHSISYSKSTSDKITWGIGIFITGIAGSIIYYFVKFRKSPKP